MRTDTALKVLADCTKERGDYRVTSIVVFFFYYYNFTITVCKRTNKYMVIFFDTGQFMKIVKLIGSTKINFKKMYNSVL